MSQGSLISFMLYQSSLSSSFDALGYCFTGMSAAVGECTGVLAPALVNAMHRWQV
jgi:hypothetical protein